MGSKRLWPIRADDRPTLASWPTLLYDWSELPERFAPALRPYRDRGLPREQVVYIPKIHQYAAGTEYLIAYLDDTVVILTGRDDGTVEETALKPGEVTCLTYSISLLQCTITVNYRKNSCQRQVSFAYNKTKDHYLLPVMNLLLGLPRDAKPAVSHPDSAQLRALYQRSYAMYNTAKLCYRLSPAISGSLFLQGKNYGPFRWHQPKPEYFLAWMDRGLVVIEKNFYVTSAAYLLWEQFRRGVIDEADFPSPGPRKRTALLLERRFDPPLAIPLLPDQLQEAERFLHAIPKR